MADPRTCQKCGSPVPYRSPESLCPRCMLLAGMGNGSESDLPAESAETCFDATPAPSVLEMIDATVGSVPRVLLRDTAVGETASPIIRPSGGNDPSIRYRIDGEIARGGMGSVLKGRDPDLGRDVAIKVLREDHRENGDLVRRFVEEAQIGGQLQHPGVVPIYELGTFADKRPFFSMKLVKGQTLAELLEARSDPTDDLPRFLSIFAAVCQTMAYSHTRGVIHRDLKPSNVMVGSFGEVQVMDWGLAKVLPRGGVVADAKAGKEKPPETLIATARSGSNTDLSRAGSVLGTPSYMAPEQARGETDLINERADVFALGSILCEILTGSPFFTGRSSGEIVRKAAKGDTAEALTRLDGCGADAELVALARDCLAVEQEDRPHDANIVSDRITAYLAGVQERLQAAERDRAVAVARAVEERKRRRLAVALAGSVLLLFAAIGCGWAWITRDRMARALSAARTLSEANTEARMERDRALAGPDDDIAHWVKAVAACRRAELVLTEAVPDAAARAGQMAFLDGVRREAAEAEGKVEAARADRRVSERLAELWVKVGENLDRSWLNKAWCEAFRDYGIDVESLSPEEAGRRIASRPIAVELASWLDWWIFNQQELGDRAGVRRLLEIANAADPDPWRTTVRKALAAQDEQALIRLADSIDLDAVPALSAHRLALGLFILGEKPKAVKLLKELQPRHPDDHWINSDLAMMLLSMPNRPLDEVIRFASAAVAIRPGVPYARRFLTDALTAAGRSDEAMAEFRELLRINPDNATAHYNYGIHLKNRGKLKEAIYEYGEAIRLNPGNAEAHCNLAQCLQSHGDYAESLAMYRKGHELGSKRPDWRYPSAKWVAYAERMAGLAIRLPALLKGDDRPAEIADSLALAKVCYDTKRYVAAARFWAEALEADPRIGDDRRGSYRYDAACAAVLASTDQGKDDPAPDDTAKTKLKSQALGWLKAELEAWAKLMDAGDPNAPALVHQTLQRWLADSDLAGIRDALALAKFPSDEQKAWRTLWADVDLLLKRAVMSTAMGQAGQGPGHWWTTLPTSPSSNNEAAETTGRGRRSVGVVRDCVSILTELAPLAGAAMFG